MIKVLLFASLREALDTGEVVVSESVATVAELIEQLARGHGDHWQDVLTRPAVLVAVNHTVADHRAALKAGDEVAFYPPVTGG